MARTEAGFAAYGWSHDLDTTLRHGMAAGLKAVQLDERNPYSHYGVAITHTFGGAFETLFRRNVALTRALLSAIWSSERRTCMTVSLSRQLNPWIMDRGFRPMIHRTSVGFSFSRWPTTSQVNHNRRSAPLGETLSLRPHWHAAPNWPRRAVGRLAISSRPDLPPRSFSHDPGGDLIQSIARFNPAWAEEIDTAVGQASQEQTQP